MGEGEGEFERVAWLVEMGFPEREAAAAASRFEMVEEMVSVWMSGITALTSALTSALTTALTTALTSTSQPMG